MSATRSYEFAERLSNFAATPFSECKPAPKD